MSAKTAKLLRIYLQDQDAALLISQRIARRSGLSNKGTPHGDFLAGLALELEDDALSLEAVMRRLGVPRSRFKRASTWGAEKMGRMKLNGRLIRYSDLSRMYEVEGLTALIGLKRSMWRSLKESYGDKELDGIDLDALIDRATKQLAELESRRAPAAPCGPRPPKRQRLEARPGVYVETGLDQPEISTHALGAQSQRASVGVRHLLPAERDYPLAASFGAPTR